jgi:TonB family protein
MKATLIAGLVLVAAQVGTGAQDSLSAAKDLYASAAYEDALSTLTRLTAGGGAAPEIARQVDEYRAFCLYALGRTGEAESVAETMIRREPMMKLDSPDVSPRLEVMFATVRKRLLPSLIRERFKTARTALEQKNLKEAEPQLVEAKLMIADAEKLAIKDDGLADLSVLVDGFLQLVRSTADQRQPTSTADQRQATAQPAAGNMPQESPAAPAPAPRRTEGAPTPASRRSEAAPAPAPQRSEAAPAVPASAARVYTVDDVGVVPPAVINQRMPAMTPDLVRITKATKTSAVVELVIDEKGDVVDATIIKSVNTSFDNIVLGAARRWKYRPALKDGVAVRYLKTLILVP